MRRNIERFTKQFIAVPEKKTDWSWWIEAITERDILDRPLSPAIKKDWVAVSEMMVVASEVLHDHH